MKPYRIKHIQSGLYYKPSTSSKNNLSENGKIYTTKRNVLNMPNSHELIRIVVESKSRIYNKTKSLIDWGVSKKYQFGTELGQFWIDTLKEDWAIEEI